MVAVILQKVIFWGLGSTLLVLGGIASGFWPFYLNSQLQERLVLANNSESFHLWKVTPKEIPMFMDFYMFNWTNPEETLNNKAIPHFVEVGPYVFSEEHTRVKIAWNDNDTVTFKQVRKWIFRPELSNGSLSDKITNVNVIAMLIGSQIKQLVPTSLYWLVNKLVKLEGKVYVTKSVNELLFDGYYDIFLNIAKDLEKVTKVKIPMDKFGWFYKRNMSADYDGVFNMMTGASSLTQLGEVKEWNGRTATRYFSGECGTVRGTTGEMWPLDSAMRHTATIFATDLCGTLDLVWSEETTVLGLTGSRFIGDSSVFSNGTKCFCPRSECPPFGLREISTCRMGAPAFVSFPHFYLGDPILSRYVSGMRPSQENHTFDITLHKNTGIPLGVNARLQINILIDKIPGLSFYEGLPKAYMPMLWFNERAAMTPGLASQLTGLSFFMIYLESLFLMATCLGAVLFVIGLFLWSNGTWRSSVSMTPLLNVEEDQ